MDAISIAEKRRNATWLAADQADFDEFRRQVSRQTRHSDWPNAVEIASNVPVYSAAGLAAAAGDNTARQVLCAEWAHAFSEGPGVIVIRGALADHSVIDRANAIFTGIIEEQHRSGAGGADHFAKPGANDRIWNALQKHCLADAENFVDYYANDALALASQAWVGPGYQMTAQVNRVNPGGAAQSAHRDYHLGFMDLERACAFPGHVHTLSPLMTLQGAIAHCDMPLESGPTLFLPYSQTFSHGYVVYPSPRYQEYFSANRVQLPLAKGDAVFFNPALMHAAGANRSTDIYRMANLFQVSSAMGRPIETVDRIATAKAAYPALAQALKDKRIGPRQSANVIASAAEGYPFPTNLDTDPPVGGLVPKSQAEFMAEALARHLPAAEFNAGLDAMEAKRRA